MEIGTPQMCPEEQQPIVTYSSETELVHPLRTIRTMGVQAWRGRHLAWRLFRRSITSEFRDALFGFLWNFADPIIIALAFLLLRHGGIIDPESLPIPFGAYVMYGMLLLQLFIQSLVLSVTIVKRSASLITNTKVSAEPLIVADLLRLGFDLLCQLPVLLIASIAVDAIDPVGFIAYILLSPSMIVLGYGLGLLAASLNVLYRDIEMFVRNLSRPLIFICPTFYRPSASESILTMVDQWSPISILMNNLRLLATMGKWHSPVSFIVTTVGAIGLLAIAWIFFHVSMRLVAEKA